MRDTIAYPTYDERQHCQEATTSRAHTWYTACRRGSIGPNAPSFHPETYIDRQRVVNWNHAFRFIAGVTSDALSNVGSSGNVVSFDFSAESIPSSKFKLSVGDVLPEDRFDTGVFSPLLVSSTSREAERPSLKPILSLIYAPEEISRMVVADRRSKATRTKARQISLKAPGCGYICG